MPSSANSGSLMYTTDYSTRIQGLVERINDIYNGFYQYRYGSQKTVIHELCQRFSTISQLILVQPLPRSLAFLPA